MGEAGPWLAREEARQIATRNHLLSLRMPGNEEESAS